MEEILASIRRIIADDQSLPRTRPARGEATLHAIPPETAKAEQWSEPEALGAPAVTEIAPPPSDPVVNEIAKEATSSELLSPNASQSVAQAFEALDRTMKMQSDGTLDDMSRELLRPMLKNWLDENLPAMVERLVKAEIERVVRGGR